MGSCQYVRCARRDGPSTGGPGRRLGARRSDGLRHYLLPIEERGGRVLRVVTAPGSDPVRVITAFLDRRLKGEEL